MLANHILQKTINDIFRITGAACSVWNMEGKCLVKCGETDDFLQGKITKYLEASEYEDMRIEDKEAFFLIRDNLEPIYILVLHESIDSAEMVGRLCVSQLESLLHAYQIRVDKNQFFQNLLLDNLLLVDIYNQAKKLGLENEKKRVVLVIEAGNDKDKIAVETLKGMYASEGKDFVTSVDENHVILIKTLGESDQYKEVNDIAKIIVNTINTEAMLNGRVAYGTIVTSLKEVSKSYKEAKVALEVGRVFYLGRNVLAYNELGIGRLIHQLPISLCEMFLKEVFEGKAAEQFDEETLGTVNRFFENNLNISETARKLYIHRNTLVYRLEKIQKLTGLDVRVFDDALTFKIALMVSEHLKFMRSEI